MMTNYNKRYQIIFLTNRAPIATTRAEWFSWCCRRRFSRFLRFPACPI